MIALLMFSLFMGRDAKPHSVPVARHNLETCGC